MQGDSDAAEQVEQYCQPKIQGMLRPARERLPQDEALNSCADKDCEEIDHKADVGCPPTFARTRPRPAKKGREGRREDRPDELAIHPFVASIPCLPEVEGR